MKPASPPPPLSPAWAMDSSGNTPTAVRTDGWYVIRAADHVYVGHDHRTLDWSEIDVFKNRLYPHLQVQAVVRLTENPGLVQLRVQIVWPGHLGGVEYFARDVDTFFPVAVFEPPRPLPPTPSIDPTTVRDAIRSALVEGASAERAAIAAWLRGEAEGARKVVREHGDAVALSEHAAYEDAALRIERGEHIPTTPEEGT